MLRKIAQLLSPDAAGGTATATPPAVPAAPAAPAKAPATAAPDADAPNEFDKLDDMIARNRGKEPAKPDDKATDKKSDEKGDLRDKTADKKEVPPEKKDDKLAVAPDPSRQIVSGPKALRDQLEKTSGELKTYREKADALEKRIAEYEGKGKDATALSERLKAVEAEKEAAISEIRMLKHEAGPEFKAKYDAPIKRAADHAVSVVEQLNIQPQEAEDGTVIPGRKATGDDLVRIFNMNYGDAQESAEKMFGKGERIVMGLYMKLKDLHAERDAGLKELKDGWKQAEEKEKADAIQQQQQREEGVKKIQQAWVDVNKEIVNKDPERFAADPKDPEEAKIVESAYGLWDVKPKSALEQVVKDANIRNRIVSEALSRHRLGKLKDRVAELEAALAEAKDSRPGATRKAGWEEAPKEKSWDADLRDTLAER